MCISLQHVDLNRQKKAVISEIEAEVAKAKWLSAKEKKAYLYIINGGSRKIGDMCKALKTTVPTLLGKTLPGLRAKGLIDR